MPRLIKREIINNDTVFIGTPVEIIEQMRRQQYFERTLIPLEKYFEDLVTLVAVQLKKQGEHGTFVPKGNTFEKRANSFIDELVRLGYFKDA